MSSLREHPIVPLATPASAAETVVLREGLLAGGIGVVEVGLRAPYSEEALGALAASGEMLVGAGTIRSVAQAERAISLGAEFIVSPGLSEPVVRWAMQLGVPVVPGVATASEVMRACELGLDFLKVFPATIAGGTDLLDAFFSVFPEVRFMPSGGVNGANFVELLRHPAVGAVSGSWITSPAALRKGSALVAENARAALATLGEASEGPGAAR